MSPRWGVVSAGLGELAPAIQQNLECVLAVFRTPSTVDSAQHVSSLGAIRSLICG